MVAMESLRRWRGSSVRREVRGGGPVNTRATSRASELKTWKENFWESTSNTVGTTRTTLEGGSESENKPSTAPRKMEVARVAAPEMARAPPGGGMGGSVALGVAAGVVAAALFKLKKQRCLEKMRYMETAVEPVVMDAAAGPVQAARIEDMEEDIDRLYDGLEEVAREGRKRASLTTLARAEGSPGKAAELEREVSRVAGEQRASRELLVKLERELGELAGDRDRQGGRLDSHVDKTARGFQDAIEALNIMKDKVDDFESKLTELGQVDTAAILGRLETVERGGEEYLRSAREQELKVGELSRRVDEVAAAAAAATAAAPLAATPVEAAPEGSSAVEEEVAAIREALEGTTAGMRKLEGELSEVIGSIQRQNKFSLFLHRFYIALQGRLHDRRSSLQDFFSAFDGDCDGALSASELLRMLEDLVPDSTEEDRRSLLFFLDPLGEGKIHYGRILAVPSVNNGAGGLHEVKFQISYYTPPNQHLRVCGAHEDLGFWNVSSAPKLYETEHGSWECDIRLPGGQVYEYKYVVCDRDEAVEWLPGANLVLELPPAAASTAELRGRGGVVVKDKWNAHPSSEPLGSSVNTRSNILRMLSSVESSGRAP